MINKNTSSNGVSSLAYTLTDPSGLNLEQTVSLDTSYSYSFANRPGELFNVGGGSFYKTYTSYNYGYGSYVFTPKNDATIMIHMWGAGGGGRHHSGGRWAGGGGYTQAIVDVVANTPYTIVVGQAGNHSDLISHGGGGRGHNSGGSGGGLSGLFFNTSHYGTASWNGTAPVSQANALAIAGGGGGGGHHNPTSHHGNGGGGGGWVGKRGHNSNPGSQTSGGSAGYSNATAGFALHGGNSANSTSWLGGGGGGWFGGGGGGHSGAHHDGGSGGSGHLAYSSTVGVQPNNALSRFVRNGWLERAPGHVYYSDGRPANFYNPLCRADGGHSGDGGSGGQHTDYESTSDMRIQRHGKVILTLANPILKDFNFPQHTSVENPNGWTQSF